MGARARVSVCVGEYADAIVRALKAEATQPRQPSKGVVEVGLQGRCVQLFVEAGDLGDLRALLNSYMYLVHAAYSSLRRLEGFSGH